MSSTPREIPEDHLNSVKSPTAQVGNRENDQQPLQPQNGDPSMPDATPHKTMEKDAVASQEEENDLGHSRAPNDTTASKTEQTLKRDVQSQQEQDITEPSARQRSESTNSIGAAVSGGRSNHSRNSTNATNAEVSEWSHQQLAPHKEKEEKNENDNGEWQDMPAFAKHDIYDDDGKIVAHAAADSDDEARPKHRAGAAKGYTKVQVDEDAQSATSLDEDTAYLFKEPTTNLADEDEDLRDPIAQMETTKDLLNENQKIAYVGVVRLAMAELLKDADALERTRKSKKTIDLALESLKMWSQKMMVRLYAHMELDSAEQLMIEQLAQHGLQASDLTPSLMENARVKNPLKDKDETDDKSTEEKTVEKKATETDEKIINKDERMARSPSTSTSNSPALTNPQDEFGALPPYQAIPTEGQEVTLPSEVPQTENVDLDLRWTVLCDLFLILISDSVYDSRSRVVLEKVGEGLSIDGLDICRFEKRVTEALEMQEAKDKEVWDENDHIESRRKAAKRRRMIMMGMATVGGGLVIGLSAGLLAPVIGAGLAAGFTTLGVSGTQAFLAGAGGATIVASSSAVAGGTIGGRSANRRTGAVKTFEYIPLHNNKRVNLIVTVGGWMVGKADDVRLPFSTVNPVMGDMYSIYWEPEMLRSVGQTINILANEALTQGLQHILGSTILFSLMAALQIPIVLSKLSYAIDNPWSNSVARADKAGLILADSLIDRNLGARPITLVAFSLGARLVFSALQELAKRGAVGLVQNVYLFGSPIIANKDQYLKARAIVSGRFVNAYATNDWILGYLFRATSGGISRVAGLNKVEVPGVENFDVTKFVPGHMAYRTSMPRVMREVGWDVESDEFAEIEDPDPDNHEARQRRLINEIEEARKELQEQPEKKKKFFGLFQKKNASEKKSWEIYDDASKGKAEENTTGKDSKDADGNGENRDAALFDVDAIQKEVVEVAAQGLEVKQLESTLPPLRLDSSAASSESEGVMARPNPLLRSSKSLDGSPQQNTGHKYSSSPSLKAEERLWSNSSDNVNNVKHEEDNISMSFASEFDPKPQHRPFSPQRAQISSPAMSSPTNFTATEPHPQEGKPVVEKNSVGNSYSNGYGHDAWIDDDDEFAEKEPSMTFA
ncbi:MAG: hypothetical protein M1831_000360 [Alyxoria varia]|nr:MAG: hypothetical protein M1831_000360 [Alyxoria varia]